MHVRGDFGSMSLADVLIWLANREKTGVLVIESGGVKKKVTVEGGSVVRVSSSNPHEYLGQVMVAFGLITEEQLQRAFETQKETGVLLGRILVMIGLVSEEQVVQTLQYNIRETIFDALRWNAGTFLFEEASKSEARPEIEVAVPLLEIHREGARRAGLWESFKRVFPSQSMTLAVNEGRVPESATPQSVDGRILALARLGLTVEAIKLELHATDFHVHARLFELHRAGAIEPREVSGTGIESVFPDVTPPKELGHTDLARHSFAARDYPRAIEHAKQALRANPADEVMVELVRQAEGHLLRELQKLIPSDEAVPQLLHPPGDLAGKRMTARERYILTRIDGIRSIRTIMQVSPMREIEALQIFHKFVRDGLIRV